MKKKLMLMLAGLGLVAGGLLFAPANGADFEGCISQATEVAGVPGSEYGDVCGGGSQDGTGYVYADGAESNPDPVDGFISASNDGSQDEDGVCASDQGDPGEEYEEVDGQQVAVEDDDETPMCGAALANEVPAP